MPRDPIPAIALAGPTASGKTAAAFAIAEALAPRLPVDQSCEHHHDVGRVFGELGLDGLRVLFEIAAPKPLEDPVLSVDLEPRLVAEGIDDAGEQPFCQAIAPDLKPVDVALRERGDEGR